MIVTIDGPAGAGKSTAAKLLAERLAFEFLDTGAMYRAVTLAAVRQGIVHSDEPAYSDLMSTLHLEMSGNRVLLNGEDVAGLLRTPEISAHTSPVASKPVVRRKLVELQRQFGNGRDIVTEGRDQGTIVFPHAEAKFYLLADPALRAQRRFLELKAKGAAVTFEAVLADQEARDAKDRERDIAPMKPAEDAVVLDSTKLSVAEVVTQMEAIVRGRQ